MEDTELRTRLEALAYRTAPPPQDVDQLVATVAARHHAGRRQQWLLTAAAAVVAVVVAVLLTKPGVFLGLDRDTDPASPAIPTGVCTTPTRGPVSPPTLTEPIATTTWTTYTSDQYGFKVGHPSDWNVFPAGRSWGVGYACDPLSPAHDTFQSPSGAVSVSVWQVPLDPGTGIESIGDIAAWVEEYCGESGNTPCTGINDRAVELCLEKWDCHPGLLVPFENNVQAFFSGGIYDAGAMTVVAVWHGESAPAVAPFGGSQRLLEAFLSTMAVWPASTPRDERYCYGRPPSGLSCQDSD